LTLGNQPDSGFASTSLSRAPIRSAFAQYRFVFGSYGPLIRPSLTMASHTSLPVRGICLTPFLASQCYEPSAPRTRIIQPEAFGQTGDASRKDSAHSSRIASGAKISNHENIATSPGRGKAQPTH